MKIVLITGSSGLIGSEACRFWDQKGFEVIGLDNDMRSYFFGADASTLSTENKLKSTLNNFSSYNIDIRDFDKLNVLFSKYSSDIKVIIHTAAQPSHDWAAKEPLTDYSVNAVGTLNLLELTRQYCPEAAFIFTSTNKVYGDTPNRLPLTELEYRWEVREDHPFYEYGIDESMSVDQSKHSLFGASKLSADVLVQEYGKYFGMKTAAFRGGCLTGPSHKGAELHGFLAYLIRCAIEDRHYTIFGYKGKQVRDNIHSADLIKAFWLYYQNPTSGEVYNIGGSRNSNISILEAIDKIEEFSGKRVSHTVSDNARSGDHIWYISDIRKFRSHYPDFEYDYNIDGILKEMLNAALGN